MLNCVWLGFFYLWCSIRVPKGLLGYKVLYMLTIKVTRCEMCKQKLLWDRWNFFSTNILMYVQHTCLFIFLFLFAYILIRAWSSVTIIFETVCLISEFSLTYLLIFEDQILAPDFTSRYQKKNSQMRFWENSETRIHWSMINIIEKIKKSFLGYK